MRKIKHKLDSRGTKDKIIELFFAKHLKPVEIAKEIKSRYAIYNKDNSKRFKIYSREKKQEGKKTKKRIKLKNEYMHKTEEKRKKRKSKNIKNY